MIYHKETKERQGSSLGDLGSLRRTVGRIFGFGSEFSHQLYEQLCPA
jgi:hypothetical protein